MAIDFKKLSERLAEERNKTPEQKEKEHQEWLEKQIWYQYQKKIEQLKDFSMSNPVSEFENRFISSVYNQIVVRCKDISEKQKKVVDDLMKKLLDR